jgi:uncharacterized protein YbbK (DUF523 family)
MHLVEHPELIASWPAPTPERPWVVMISGCIMGLPCGVDGTDYGFGGALHALTKLSKVEVVAFCPEDAGLGTPRTMPDLHGGDGFDVLDGRARVLDEHGVDLTEGMVAGALAMAATAREKGVRFAVLTDASAACGSQVIPDGCRFDEPRRRRRGVGVATAALARAGVPVMSQRDSKTLGRVLVRLDPSFVPDPAAHDHHESPWVRENLPDTRVWPV